MKKNLFVFTYLIFIIISTITAQPTVQEKQLRDSIFKAYHSQKGTDNKMFFICSQYHENIGKKWAIELLDSALQLSIAQKDSSAEISIRRDYIMHYKYMTDVPKMEYYLNELKTASHKYRLYTLYFQACNDILQFYNARGDTEYSRIQSAKMEEEARKLNNEEGIAYAYLSLAQSLAASKKEEEAIKVYRKALQITVIPPLARSLIHSEIVTAYQQIGKDREAIKELGLQKKVLEQYIKEIPARASYHADNFLELELTYCASYDNMNDANNLLKHLNEAQKYYVHDCFFSNYIGYHAYWGAYFRLTQQWEKCLQEYDTALAHFDDTMPLEEMEIRRKKGKALIESGRYEDAAILYKELSLMGDSLNKDVMKYHQEALQSNYNIREVLLEKSTLEKRYNWIIATFVLATVVILLLMVLRAYKGNKALQRAERETRETLETVDAANKMKDVFLHNIIHQIREPLNVVVGFSSILATENDLDPELSQEYSVSIKKNASLLFQLIIDVLDLSRLESGMMKFNISECDAVELCKEAKMSVEMQENNTVHLTFETESETLAIQTDYERFLKMLLSVLAEPESNKTIKNVVYKLQAEGNQLRITVLDSPLLEQPENIQRIKHDINRLFLETFKGTYQAPLNQDKGDIIITYPLS